MATKKYMLTKDISVSLLEESINSIDFFTNKIKKDEYMDLLKEKNKKYVTCISRLSRWSKELKGFKDNPPIDDEVKQLVFTLKWALFENIGYSYIDSDGDFHTNYKLENLYYKDRTNSEEFNKNFDEAYLMLGSTYIKLSMLYDYLNKYVYDKNGIENFNVILNKIRKKVMNEILDRKEMNIDEIKRYLLLIGYEDGIELLHKTENKEYTIEDIKSTIKSRLGVINTNIKRG